MPRVRPSIEIVDRGRGPQLSTCRITVQDVVPYLQHDCTPEEIMAIMPVLSMEEIKVIQQYVHDNYDAVMEQDRRIRERNAKRTTPLEVQEIRKKGRTKVLTLMEEFACRSSPSAMRNGCTRNASTRTE